jgi:hypothetical protein
MGDLGVDAKVTDSRSTGTLARNLVADIELILKILNV